MSSQLVPGGVVHELPADLRKAAGEFYCEGTSWPAQVWQDECRKYLVRRFGHTSPPKPTRLDRLAGQGEITFHFRKADQ